MRMVVNHLVFPGSVGGWFTRPANSLLTETQVRLFFSPVINAMIAGVAGLVDHISVVNEPWHEASGRPTDLFREIRGAEYIRFAYQTEREAVATLGLGARPGFSETLRAYGRAATRAIVEDLRADGLTDVPAQQAHAMNGTLICRGSR